jgi:hypothetical protein
MDLIIRETAVINGTGTPARVEDMSLNCLRASVPWDWRTTDDTSIGWTEPSLLTPDSCWETRLSVPLSWV